MFMEQVKARLYNLPPLPGGAEISRWDFSRMIVDELRTADGLTLTYADEPIGTFTGSDHVRHSRERKNLSRWKFREAAVDSLTEPLDLFYAGEFFGAFAPKA